MELCDFTAVSMVSQSDFKLESRTNISIHRVNFTCRILKLMRNMIYVLFLISVKSIAADHRFDIPDVELTTIVQPKTRECFYQHTEKRQILRLEFQVIDAGISSQDLKISLDVRSPSGKNVLKVVKKQNKVRRITSLETGDYQICLDNSFSVLASKTVYFEISLEINEESLRREMLNEMNGKFKNNSISLLRKTARTVKNNLETIGHYQDTIRAVEARDINIQEKNLVKINTISSLTSVSIMLFGYLHLFVMRSMFNRKSLLYKIFKILC